MSCVCGSMSAVGKIIYVTYVYDRMRILPADIYATRLMQGTGAETISAGAHGRPYGSGYSFFGVYMAFHHDASPLSQRSNHATMESIHLVRLTGSMMP